MKDDIFRIENVSHLCEVLGQPKALHPLVTVIDFSKVKKFSGGGISKITTGMYSILLKGLCPGSLRYGREYYDFQEGTMVFMAPEQLIIFEEDENKPKPNETDPIMSWGIYFHPDLIRGTSLYAKMKEYTFFSYDSNEALHISDKEKIMLSEIVDKVDFELNQNIDKHSQSLIVSNIELLLNYCVRYYDRQFITRTSSNKGLLTKFEELLESYFDSDQIQLDGLPSVKHLADKLNLSANYLGDLLKKETGKNAQEHIHYHLIEEAKSKLLVSTKTVGEIAFELGFEYPQYFSKMFKSKTGMTPVEYRNVN